MHVGAKRNLGRPGWTNMKEPFSHELKLESTYCYGRRSRFDEMHERLGHGSEETIANTRCSQVSFAGIYKLNPDPPHRIEKNRY